jgi:hypothetical protein
VIITALIVMATRKKNNQMTDTLMLVAGAVAGAIGGKLLNQLPEKMGMTLDTKIVSAVKVAGGIGATMIPVADPTAKNLMTGIGLGLGANGGSELFTDFTGIGNINNPWSKTRIAKLPYGNQAYSIGSKKDVMAMLAQKGANRKEVATPLKISGGMGNKVVLGQK